MPDMRAYPNKEEIVTDRIHAITVVLDDDYRVDSSGYEDLITAIGTLKGVLSVKGHVSNLEVHSAEERARSKLRLLLWDVLK